MSASLHRISSSAEAAQDGHERAAAADDHVGPGLLEARVVDAVGAGLGGEGAEHVLGRLLGQHEVVDGVAVVGRRGPAPRRPRC